MLEEVHQAKEDVATSAGKVEKTNSVSSEQKSLGVVGSTFKAKNEKFQYGNYNQYYGYRCIKSLTINSIAILL